MPPAFILSQDQTLHNEKPDRPPRGRCSFNWFYAQKKGVGGSLRRLTLHIEPPPPRRGHRISAMRSVCLPPRGPPRGAHSHCAVRFPRSSTPSSGDESLIYHPFPVPQVGCPFFLAFFGKKCRFLSNCLPKQPITSSFQGDFLCSCKGCFPYPRRKYQRQVRRRCAGIRQTMAYRCRR